jgi:DNA-binding response OmpR family regulator
MISPVKSESMHGACLVQGSRPYENAVDSGYSTRILVIDDDPALCLLLESVLEREYDVIIASDGLEGVRAFHETRPDLVLLDTMLPRLDGWEVLRRIREVADTPVIVLTARQATDDIVRGLRSGADDYVTKPFTVEVLEARVQALLRRVTREQRQARASGRVELDDGRLAIDLVRAQVEKNGQVIDLSATEYRLLAFLAQRPDQLVQPSEILTHVWGPEYADELGYVKSYVRLLRRKIEDDPKAPRYLIARRGLGYTLVGRPAPH